MSSDRALLAAGVAVPFLYFGTVFGAALLYPGYSHVSQYASELGMAGQPSAALFNGGILATGVATLLGSFGISRGARRAGARPVAAVIGALLLGLFGLGLMMGGLFPMPDPRHGGFGLGMSVHLAPFALAAALWRLPGRRRLCVFLMVTGVAAGVLLAIMMGVGGLVTRADVGLFQRTYALTLFPWIGILSASLGSVPVRGSS